MRHRPPSRDRRVPRRRPRRHRVPVTVQRGKRPSGALAISASIGLKHPFDVRSIIPFGPDRQRRTPRRNQGSLSSSCYPRQVFQAVGPFTQDMPDLHFTRSLDVYRPRDLADEVILNQFVSFACVI